MSPPISRCFACGDAGLEPFYECPRSPISGHILLPSRAEALSVPRGEIRLAFCNRCGFIQNLLFRKQDMEYEPPETYPAAHVLAGSFAFDELSLPGGLRDEAAAGGPDSTAEPLLAGSRELRGPDASVISRRYTLSHTQEVGDAIKKLRRTLVGVPEAVASFQTADVRRTLLELAFSDVSYSRCSYFSVGSLAHLLRACDFDIFDLRLGSLERDILMDAVAATGTGEPHWPGEDDLADSKRLVAYFRDNYEARVFQWRRHLQRARDEGQKAVLWGAGTKAVSFLVTLAVQDIIAYVVDGSPPCRSGFLPGTGHEVLGVQAVRQYKPGLIVAMNREDVPDIRRELAAAGLTADIILV